MGNETPVVDILKHMSRNLPTPLFLPSQGQYYTGPAAMVVEELIELWCCQSRCICTGHAAVACDSN